MKTPVPPPNLDRLLSEQTPESIGRVLSAMVDHATPPVDAEYLSWDKMRHLEPPPDVTHEQWWLAVKLARRSVARQISGLVDVDGQAFSYALPDQLLQGIDEVNSNARGNIAISEQVTNPSTRDRYLVSSLIEEAITSSQLEGASTTRRVAKEMIRTGREPVTKDERMILNNYAAMRYVADLAQSEVDLTPGHITTIHRIVTDGTLDRPDSAGVVQSNQDERVSVWGDGDQLLHRPPPVDQLAARLEALCAFANGRDSAYMPPVLRAITVHFMMGYDHYFEDGNGRTARAAFYWSMLRQGYWLTEFLTISKILKKAPGQYARSFLLTEDDDGDLTYFFLYHLRVILRAITDLHEHLARKAEEVHNLQRTIRAHPGEFNYRQLALLEHAIRNPDANYTSQSHATSHGTSNETARQDLTALEGRGLLDRVKVGRKFVWMPADNLERRLRSL